MNQPLRVLIVEDSEADGALLLRALRHGGYEATYEVVDTPEAMRAALVRQDWDVITSDHAMPHFSAPAALALAKAMRPDVPFIIVSGEIDLNLAVSLMKGGAQDYIQKRELARLVPAIARELRDVEARRERQRAQAALREHEARFRLLVEGGKDQAIFMLDPAGYIVGWHAGAECMKGYEPDEIIGQHFSRVYRPEDRAQHRPEHELEVAMAVGKVEAEGWRVGQDGVPFWAHVVITALRDEAGQVRGFVKVTRDVTERRRMEEQLRASETRYRRLFESARDGILILDTVTHKITDVNPFMVELLGYRREEFLRKELWEIGLLADAAASQEAFRALQATGYIRYEDLPLQTNAGVRWGVEFVSNVYLENGHQVIQCNIRDITGLLDTFGEVGRMSTSMWEIEKFPIRNDAVFPPRLWIENGARPPHHPGSPNRAKSPLPCARRPKLRSTGSMPTWNNACGTARANSTPSTTTWRCSTPRCPMICMRPCAGLTASSTPCATTTPSGSMPTVCSSSSTLARPPSACTSSSTPSWP